MMLTEKFVDDFFGTVGLERLNINISFLKVIGYPIICINVLRLNDSSHSLNPRYRGVPF